MNILPKKRWHVRTKENIARVRKDEAEAAEKEKQERLRIDKADREARLNVLKYRSKEKLQELGITVPEQPEPNKNINLFTDFENAIKTTNKEHDKEVKDKKEEYEKKIGYLTYLGQDTNEALGKKNWYEVAPESSRFSRTSQIKDTYDKLVLKDQDGKPKPKDLDIKDGEVFWKKKQMLDPINLFTKYLHKDKNVPKYKPVPGENQKETEIKHKKKPKKCKDDEKETKLQKLREARLRREQQEKYRTELFLTGIVKPAASIETNKHNKIKPKYNSQFNPELARQNYR